MRSIRLVACALFILAGSCSRLVAQPWTMVPSSLFCRMSNFEGTTPLPACYKVGESFQDDVTFSVTATCQSPCASKTLPTLSLTQNIGENGMCDDGVAWMMQGGVEMTGAPPYVWARFNATSMIAFARITGSEDCSGVPYYDGPIGQGLPCT